MVEKIGIVVPHLGVCQQSFMAISHINRILSKSNDYDFFLFYEDMVPSCVRPLCASMNINEIWSFDGILIGTTLSTTMSIVRTVNASRKVFYVWDLEWMREGYQNYFTNIKVYKDKTIYIISRSISHAHEIERYSGRKSNMIVPNFNLEYIINELCGRQDRLYS